MGVKFVVPICFIICLIHWQCFMVHSIIIPLPFFVEEEHFFGCFMSVNHVKVKALVLFHEHSPRSAPVVILCDWDHLTNWNVHSLYTVEPEHIHWKILGIWVKLHAENEALAGYVTFEKEWNHWEDFCFVVWSHHLAVEITTCWCLLQLYYWFRLISVTYGQIMESHIQWLATHQQLRTQQVSQYCGLISLNSGILLSTQFSLLTLRSKFGLLPPLSICIWSLFIILSNY